MLYPETTFHHIERTSYHQQFLSIMEALSLLRCDSDHNESPWSQFIADTEGRFSPMQMSLPRNFSPLTPVDTSEGTFCSSKFSPTSCFPPPAKKRAVRCVYHQKENHSDHYHLAIDVDPIGIEAARVSSECGGTAYGSPIDHVWGYNFSPYTDQTTDDDDQNTVIHDVSPVYNRIVTPPTVPREDTKKRPEMERRVCTPLSIDGESEVVDDLKTNKKQFEDSVTSLLTTWILDNQMDPYPTQSEKERLAGLSGLSLQVSLCNSNSSNPNPPQLIKTTSTFFMTASNGLADEHAKEAFIPCYQVLPVISPPLWTHQL